MNNSLKKPRRVWLVAGMPEGLEVRSGNWTRGDALNIIDRSQRIANPRCGGSNPPDASGCRRTDYPRNHTRKRTRPAPNRLALVGAGQFSIRYATMPINRRSYKQIAIGMTLAEVVAILGPPTSEDAETSSPVGPVVSFSWRRGWIWPYMISAVFANGRLAIKSQS